MSYSNVVATLALFLALGGGAFAAVKSLPNTSASINGCVNNSTGVLRVVPIGKCHKHTEVAISWNQRGVPGLAGAIGPQGTTGPQGTIGPQGLTGPPGLVGTPDTSNFYTKSQSDGLYLPVGGKATNAAALNGLPASAFESSSLFGNSRSVDSTTTTSGGHEGCYVGELLLFAGTFAPTGTVFADGQLMKISMNTALFSILGTEYGGDGISTFALPNLHDLGPGGTNYLICLNGFFPARP